MIEAVDLVKRFRSPHKDAAPLVAVDHVSFAAMPGEVFGLLGPNGAGKTTTLRLLATLMSPDAGTARIAGFDVGTQAEAARAHLGYLSTTTGLYGRLTARELLHYFAVLQGVPNPEARTEVLLDQFEVRPFADVRCDRLSTGMKQKVSIARAIVHDPPALILDEPTTGLDVLVAQLFLEFVEHARAQGRCVLFSTHIMREAERLCDRLAILHGGRILASGTLDELRERTGHHTLEDIFVHLVRSDGGRP